MDRIELYKNHLEKSFENAEKYFSKITDEIINMEGMSGKKTRHFYNNLLNIQDARYLEIGTWKGSSVCSAMYGNNATVVCMDNWKEFGGPKNQFLRNFEKYKGMNNASFIESDCFNVDISKLPKFNIYLYDGEHSVESQCNALVYYYDCLDDVFIYIVDDWNGKREREGTMLAIEKLKLKILYKKEIRLTLDDSHTEINLAKETWWNGICVFIFQK